MAREERPQVWPAEQSFFPFCSSPVTFEVLTSPFLAHFGGPLLAGGVFIN